VRANSAPLNPLLDLSVHFEATEKQKGKEKGREKERKERDERDGRKYPKINFWLQP